jgi:hypothetical protein
MRIRSLFAIALLLHACDDKDNSDGACTYVDFEEATCTWLDDDGDLSLDVVGDAGTTASASVSVDTICYDESSYGVNEPFDCALQELEDGGCDPSVYLVDLGGCGLEVE